MAARGLVYDPTRGGTKVSPQEQAETVRRIQAYAAEHFAGKYLRIEVKFRGALCYIEAYREPEEDLYVPKDETREQAIERMRNTPWPLCRLRHFRKDVWGLALFMYSSEKYETSVFGSGSFEGTPEEALELAGTLHLQ